VGFGAGRVTGDCALPEGCAHGIAVIGTLGIVLSAKRQGMIAAVRPVLDTIRRLDMYLSDQVLTEALRLIGE
jgi:predicted nucleic acid-binding protein